MSPNERLYCSPKNSIYAFDDNTCFSLKDLQIIAREYNKHVTVDKIQVVSEKKKLLKNLRDKLYQKCGNKEYCWTSLPFIRKEYKKHFDTVFRPPKPIEWYTDKKTWLNTLDILACMKQYQHLYKDFIFLGVYPIDGLFRENSGVCHGEKMCDFSIQSLKKNIKQFALILNTDPHDKAGLHWIALYCSINNKKKNFGIYFYDSVGTAPPQQVKQFMKKISLQIKQMYEPETSKNFDILYNKIPAQFDNFDCGMFTQIFITQMVKYIPFDEICKGMKNDDDINKLRDVLYRPSK